MALDRQKILSELGSVMSQLQSANCGCLGNLFEKQSPCNHYSSYGNAPTSYGGQHHSCQARPSCGASCSCNNQRQHTTDYNSQKSLLADGKNFINNSFVQPIVKDVYEEMKSICPANTIANSPLAAQLGLPCSPATPQGAQQGFVQNFDNKLANKSNIDPNLNERNNKGNREVSLEQHALGLAKFNQLFPGIMSQGDLGFDPMKVAIQMRAMAKNNNEFKRLSNKNEGSKVHPSQQSNTPRSPNVNSAPDNTHLLTNPMPASKQMNEPIPVNTPDNPYTNQVPGYSENVRNSPLYTSDQQAHYALTNQPMIQKQEANENPNQIQHQPPIDQSNPELTNNYQTNPEVRPVTQTNPETANLKHNLYPPTYLEDPYESQPNVSPELQSYENNILGQPIQMLPASVYHHPEPSLPQTLSPQPPKPQFSNVKSTISKTSLMGTKPGRTISKNNLQRMYNEYKGSQSFIPPKPTPEGVSHSEGQLNVTKPNYNVGKFERTGGDTEMDKEMVQKIAGVGQLGDIPANNPNNNVTEKPSLDTVGRPLRNGLQDIVFTSYPTSTAWSFHGRS